MTAINPNRTAGAVAGATAAYTGVQNLRALNAARGDEKQWGEWTRLQVIGEAAKGMIQATAGLWTLWKSIS